MRFSEYCVLKIECAIRNWRIEWPLRLFVMVLGALGCFGGVHAEAGSAVDAVAACRAGGVVISGGDTYPPLSWRRGDHLVGASVDMVTEILAGFGIHAKADEGGPWKRVLLRARDGEVDILLGVRKAREYEHFLVYLEPPITPSVQGVFMLKGHEFSYKDWSDLEGKSGSITLGTTFDKKFDAFAKSHLELQPVRRIEQNFFKLEKRRVDYMLAPSQPTQLYLKRFGYQDKIVAAQEPLMILEEYIAISKKSPCIQLKDEISRAMRAWIESDRFDEAMEAAFLNWFKVEGGEK
ncbi:predicted extracellular solute-binding protein [gamma proteobacterium HdN1]|nr:predicted extracellular solute-binding protein [gamma proteobacterium HdN1]